MTARLEHELRRLLADPPVTLPEPVDPSGPLAAVERRVARVRARRRAGAALSVAALLSIGVAGANQLVIASSGPASVVAVSGANGRVPAAAQPQADGQAGQPPPEVLAAARDALTEVSGGTVVQPVRWVATGDGYLVQIRFTEPVTCRYCHDPAASPRALRGPVLEVRVPPPVPAAMPAAPTSTSMSAPSGAGSAERRSSAVPVLPPRWSVLQQPTDLSRYGPVQTFTLTR